MFHRCMRLAAAKSKLRLPAGTAIDAEVDLCTAGDGYFLRARLRVNLPGLERPVAQALVETAHLTCPYSKAIRGNVEVAIEVSSCFRKPRGNASVADDATAIAVIGPAGRTG